MNRLFMRRSATNGRWVAWLGCHPKRSTELLDASGIRRVQWNEGR